MPSKGGLVIQLPPTKEMQLLVHLKGKRLMRRKVQLLCQLQEGTIVESVHFILSVSKLNIYSFFSQLQLTMKNMGETSHVNINPGPVTKKVKILVQMKDKFCSSFILPKTLCFSVKLVEQQIL